MTEQGEKSISLRAIRVFDEVARSGSLQESARALGMSAPAASQQLRNLETALGQDLLDHSRRPLMLTQAGHAYLAHARAALQELRQGAAALSLMDLTKLKRLRLGLIDDFESEVMPRLAVGLAAVLTRCELSLQTSPSHIILESLVAGALDLGIAAQPAELPESISVIPLLRDPFVLAVPRGYLAAPPRDFSELSKLAYLRYDKRQLIGRQIAAQLARLKLAPDGRIEIDSNQALFGLIANSAGWAITTPLGFLRAQRFQGQVDVYPLPFPGFARTISLFHLRLWQAGMSEVVASSLRAILQTQVVEPALAALPWLGDGLKVLDA